MDLCHIHTDEVRRIYSILVDEFGRSNDPIAPAGVADVNLLESAVDRQHVGYPSHLKYESPLTNAATLAYGLCNNHAFYNGNKRTALVALLVHLDRNKLGIWHLGKDDLFELMLHIAQHSVYEWVFPDNSRYSGMARSDREVLAIAAFLEPHVFAVKRGERDVTYRELRRLLRPYNYYLENPHANFIDVVGRQEEGSEKHIDTIAYPGNNRKVGVNVVKRVRERCHLREEDGVDSEVFYDLDEEAVIDSFINKYRTTLRRLAKV